MARMIRGNLGMDMDSKKEKIKAMGVKKPKSPKPSMKNKPSMNKPRLSGY